MIRRENGLKQYWILHTLSVALTISIVLHISGCSDTITPKTKDLKLSSSYEISAALDPNNRTLEHTTKVTVKNDGQDSTKELFFHLYGNLYKTETEGIVVSSIIDEKGKVISYELRDNYQLIFLKLNDALKGGGVATIIFACTVTIPEMVSVYGVARDGEIPSTLEECYIGGEVISALR